MTFFSPLVLFGVFSLFLYLFHVLSSALFSSVLKKALFALSFSFLSEFLFFVNTIKMLYCEVKINNMGVTGRLQLTKTDFKHACVWAT